MGQAGPRQGWPARPWPRHSLLGSLFLFFSFQASMGQAGCSLFLFFSFSLFRPAWARPDPDRAGQPGPGPDIANWAQFFSFSLFLFFSFSLFRPAWARLDFLFFSFSLFRPAWARLDFLFFSFSLVLFFSFFLLFFIFVDHKKTELSEQALIRDVVYTFQGIDGTYVRWSDRQNGKKFLVAYFAR